MWRQLQYQAPPSNHMLQRSHRKLNRLAMAPPPSIMICKECGGWTVSPGGTFRRRDTYSRHIGVRTCRMILGTVTVARCCSFGYVGGRRGVL